MQVVIANFARSYKGKWLQRVWAAASPDACWIFCINECARSQVIDYADTAYAFYDVSQVLEVVQRNRECELMRSTEYHDHNGNSRRFGSSPHSPVLPKYLKIHAAFTGRISSVARCNWLPDSGNTNVLPRARLIIQRTKNLGLLAYLILMKYPTKKFF
jgi:hypothetical protein